MVLPKDGCLVLTAKFEIYPEVHLLETILLHLCVNAT